MREAYGLKTSRRALYNDHGKHQSIPKSIVGDGAVRVLAQRDQLASATSGEMPVRNEMSREVILKRRRVSDANARSVEPINVSAARWSKTTLCRVLSYASHPTEQCASPR